MDINIWTLETFLLLQIHRAGAKYHVSFYSSNVSFIGLVSVMQNRNREVLFSEHTFDTLPSLLELVLFWGCENVAILSHMAEQNCKWVMEINIKAITTGFIYKYSMQLCANYLGYLV